MPTLENAAHPKAIANTVRHSVFTCCGELNLCGMVDAQVTSRAVRVHYARIPNRSTQMNLSERITMDPEICHGKPTIRGLRYTVESMLELLSSGMSIEEVLADYEDLEREDILAVLDFARQLSQIKRIEPIVA